MKQIIKGLLGCLAILFFLPHPSQAANSSAVYFTEHRTNYPSALRRTIYNVRAAVGGTRLPYYIDDDDRPTITYRVQNGLTEQYEVTTVGVGTEDGICGNLVEDAADYWNRQLDHVQFVRTDFSPGQGSNVALVTSTGVIDGVSISAAFHSDEQVGRGSLFPNNGFGIALSSDRTGTNAFRLEDNSLRAIARAAGYATPYAVDGSVDVRLLCLYSRFVMRREFGRLLGLAYRPGVGEYFAHRLGGGQPPINIRIPTREIMFAMVRPVDNPLMLRDGLEWFLAQAAGSLQDGDAIHADPLEIQAVNFATESTATCSTSGQRTSMASDSTCDAIKALKPVEIYPLASLLYPILLSHL